MRAFLAAVVLLFIIKGSSAPLYGITLTTGTTIQVIVLDFNTEAMLSGACESTQIFDDLLKDIDAHGAQLILLPVQAGSQIKKVFKVIDCTKRTVIGVDAVGFQFKGTLFNFDG